MSSPRAVYRLHLAVAGLGAGGAVLALAVALHAVSFAVPSPARLMAVCGRWVLPRASVASLVVLALGSFGMAVLVLAGRSAVRQLAAQRRFFRELRGARPAAGPAGPYLVFEDPRHQAFCGGFLRPRVYVSSAAVGHLSPAELKAILAHEHHHAARHDPARIFLARLLSDSLFFLPVLRLLADRYAAVAELAADRAVLRTPGGARRLAAALLAFDGSPDPAVVGIAPERVDQMLGESPRWQLPVALLASAATVVIAVVAVAWRTADATASMHLNMPLLIAQTCMVAMVLVPLFGGALFLLILGRRGPGKPLA